MVKFKSSYDKSIKIWDIDKKDYIDNITNHEENIWTVKYSLKGKTIASGKLKQISSSYNLKKGLKMVN